MSESMLDHDTGTTGPSPELIEKQPYDVLMTHVASLEGEEQAITPHDAIETIMSKTGCTYEVARRAIFFALDNHKIRLTPGFCIALPQQSQS